MFESDPREYRRQAMLRAGLELFEKKGLRDFTVADVARTAGVALQTFYLHFASREAFLDALRTRIHTDVDRAATADMVEAGEMPQQCFRALWAGLCRCAREHPTAVAFAFEAGGDPLAPAGLTQAMEELHVGGALPPSLQALLLWSVFGAFFRLLRTHPEGLTRADTDSMERACWRAIAPPNVAEW